MRALFPYIAFYKHYKWMLTLSVALAIGTLLASSGQLTLSGWFLSASAVASTPGLYSFNYMLPAAGVRAAAIVRTAGRYFERLVSHDTTFRILEELRVFIFSRLIPLSPAWLARFRHGELLNRVVVDVDTLDHLYLRVISPLVCAFVVIVVMTLGLSILDVTLAFMLSGSMLLTLFLLPPLFYHIGKPAGESLTHLYGEYRQQLTTWLQGQAELTLFGASESYREQMDSTELNWHEAWRKQAELTALAQGLMILINGIAVITMLWMASNNMDDNPQSNALIALFVFCTQAAFEVLAPVTDSFQHLGRVIIAAQRITQLIERPPEVQFTEKYTQAPEYVALSLQNVTFAYDGQMQPAINDFSLDIQAGMHVAILGRTGCGKSTLLQLLTRAYNPRHGLIYINAIPLSDFSELELRRTVSVVTQRVYLFSATLRDNLLLAAPDVDDTQLSIVLKRVGLQKLLEGEGLNSWLGEGGRQISGGELRRLAIARVLLHDAPLMLLDEPTEGLDATSESQILDLLKQVMKNKTVLMVTHRLRGLTNFDNIIVIDNGRVVEQGNYADLLEKQNSYYKLSKWKQDL